MAKYPKIVMKTPDSSNIFNITGAVMKQLRAAEVPPEVIDEFRIDVMSCPPSTVMQTCKKWVVMTA